MNVYMRCHVVVPGGDRKTGEKLITKTIQSCLLAVDWCHSASNLISFSEIIESRDPNNWWQCAQVTDLKVSCSCSISFFFAYFLEINLEFDIGG